MRNFILTPCYDRAMTTPLILDIAVPAPLRRTFYYLAPTREGLITPSIGARVSVEFGKQQHIGVIVGINPTDQTIDQSLMKPVNAILDEKSVLPGSLMELMHWASDYYQHPIGESMVTALPNALRKGLATPDNRQTCWQLVANSDISKVKAAKQLQVLTYLEQHSELYANQCKALNISNATLSKLEQLGLITASLVAPTIKAASLLEAPLTLNTEQEKVIDHYQEKLDQFSIGLLEGVTGSGKTEVYLQLIEKVLAQGKQALVLVPEIGLTPQTIARFRQRFDCEMAIFHSSLTDLQRLNHWQNARTGRAKIIIGTRSALFTATDKLGLIIIDEEHDLSYKQQDGLRYSARDTACMRAKLENIPIILGSATPSLESLHNAISGKYQHFQLTQRAGNAASPTVEILDIRKQVSDNGLAESLLEPIRECIEKGEQALLFINRRGFAPTLFCHDCGWVSQCHACDARLTVHQQTQQLRCHHCNACQSLPSQCPKCCSRQLIRHGAGTERLEQLLQQHFSDTPIFRIDRDTTAKKDALNDMLENIQQSAGAILIGTQMLAKGHHFPNVTLVIILDADQSLVSTDYRAIERFGQLITQVTGRAGRESKPGHAIIQTHYPSHPQLLRLVHFGYHDLAMDLLAERRMANLPPFSAQALVRLEDKDPNVAQKSLLQLKAAIKEQPALCIGPFPASLQRRAWHFRYQLLVQCNNRKALRQTLQQLMQAADAHLKPHRQRWSLDIDPQDMS